MKSIKWKELKLKLSLGITLKQLNKQCRENTDFSSFFFRLISIKILYIKGTAAVI